MWDLAIWWTVILGLWAVCALGVGLVALQLPGTWLMIFATGLVAWWGWDAEASGRLIGWWTLAGLLGLAVVGEVVEAVAAAFGSRAVGGSKRGALLAIFGGIGGAIVGTLVIPVPIVGTLVGAALGAGLMSGLGDKWAGRDWGSVLKGGSGAAVGKFAGSLGKLGIAFGMWVWVIGATLV